MPTAARPSESPSSVIACIAIAVGVRAAIWAMPVQRRMRLVARRDRGERRERVAAPRLAGPHRVVAEVLGRRRDLDELTGGAGLRGPVAELHAQLQVSVTGAR